ncbi:acyl carrier protein [Paenibacillus vandeheii]
MIDDMTKYFQLWEGDLFMDDVKVRIKEFLDRYLKKHELQDSDDIFSLGYVNSLFAMQLVMFLEKDFGIQVDNKDLDMNNFKSINAICEFLERKAS